ncbi:MAG: ribonuclease P protein component [Saprospiraceae bacterium]|nr:ribonuclease P protein component [Saprospiraceae bacterium]
MTRFTFGRQERLKSPTLISRLFKEGQVLMAYPLRVVWLQLPEQTDAGHGAPAQVVITVPKKHFKTAVSRNLMKRRIREAYRLQKSDLYEKLGTRRVALLLMFIAREELPFADIEAGIGKMIKKWPG